MPSKNIEICIKVRPLISKGFRLDFGPHKVYFLSSVPISFFIIDKSYMENEISKSNDRMSNFTKKLALLADDLNIFENTEVGII
jgi:hypothetical protein